MPGSLRPPDRRDGALAGRLQIRMTVAARPCQPERFHPRRGTLGRVLDCSAMRILAVETATLAGSVALLQGDRIIGESLLDIALTHSERLMAMVDRLLSDCGWDASGLDGLAVSAGP